MGAAKNKSDKSRRATPRELVVDTNGAIASIIPTDPAGVQRASRNIGRVIGVLCAAVWLWLSGDLVVLGTLVSAAMALQFWPFPIPQPLLMVTAFVTVLLSSCGVTLATLAALGAFFVYTPESADSCSEMNNAVGELSAIRDEMLTRKVRYTDKMLLRTLREERQQRRERS